MDNLLLSLIPVYICYILFIAVLMFQRRVRAYNGKKVDHKYFKAYQGEVIPYDLQIIQNHFSNQFEIPVLFLITCLAFVALKASSTLTICLGVAFIISRIWHSTIHLGKNDVRVRLVSYLIGFIIILCMWTELMLKVL